MKRPKGPASRKIRWIRAGIPGRLWVIRCNPFVGCLAPIPVPPCWWDRCPECQKAAEELEVFKKPTVRVQVDGEGFARVESPKMLSKLPTIAEVLVQPSWEDGEGKGERGLFIFVSSTLIKLLLKVECPPLKLMVSGRNWDEAWAALESVLRSGDVPWEQDSPRASTGQKKKK